MQVPRRVYYATLASLVIHGMIFGVLALTTKFTPDFQKHKEAALMAVAPIPEEPLEVVFHAAPEATPKPEPTPPPEAIKPLAPKPLGDTAKAEVMALQTQLDPKQLQKTDAAPQDAKVIASHHSKATKARARAADALPGPTPVPSANSLFRTASPASSAPPVPSESSVNRLPPAPASDALEESDTGSVAALGEWRQAVANAIGICWDRYRNSRKEALILGSVIIRFRVDAEGKVSDLRVQSNTAGPTNAMYATRSIIEAKIPPIPPERVQKLSGGRVEIDFTFTIYPNQ